MKNKCDSCKFKGEHQEMGFKPSGVCTKEHDLLKAMHAYRASECPFAKNSELKPCPFCGKTKIKVDSKRSNNMRWEGAIKLEHHVVTARCNSCHARGPSVGIWVARCNHINAAKSLEEKAIEAWNGRATDEERNDP